MVNLQLKLTNHIPIRRKTIYCELRLFSFRMISFPRTDYNCTASLNCFKDSDTTVTKGSLSPGLALNMASNNEEPSSKRSRLEEKEIHPSIRYIKLDMSKYDISLQNYTDDDLVKIFELGLNVKESASLNVDVNRKMMEDALSSQMKPIRDSVKQIEEQVNKQVKQVQEDVNEKVENEMTKFTEKVKKMKETLSSKMKPIDESVTRIEQQVNAQVLKVRQNVTQEVGSEMTKFAKNVESLKNDVSDHMTEIKDQLTNRVDTVAQKVQPLDTLNSSITTSAGDIKTKIHEEIKESEQRVSG